MRIVPLLHLRSTLDLRHSLLLAIGLLLGAAAGCYNPAITNGAQKCSADGKCPDGFTCFADKHCYKPGSNPSCAPACSGTTSMCDKMTLKCVQCLADKDCPAGNVCVAQVCKAGCTPGHPACLPDAGSCDVDLGACRGCLSNAECHDGAKPKCDKPSGLCVPCLPEDDQCPVGQFCEGKNGQFACVPGCSSNDQCAKAAQGSDDGGAGGRLVTCCNNKCVDTTADAANCGKCGTACMNNTSCCNATCVDQTSDVTNCGGCGTVCMPKNVGVVMCGMSQCGYDKCTPGFGDCDLMTANGCETGLVSDVKNCGKCGTICMAPANASVKCTAGACAIGGCNPGFADCNKSFNDGCEITTDTDIKNCGSCAFVCPIPMNAQASCAAGKCGLGLCSPNFANCNGLPGDGCETNTSNDIRNCGKCGTVCAVGANQAPLCSAGVCRTTCNAGFGDCDGMANNGCEADFSKDPNNCSNCGVKCTAQNGVPGCAAGKCTVASCNMNFADCNMNPADGCEVDLTKDPANCSKCGMACPMGKTCVGSACVNAYPAACSQDADVNGSKFVICAMNQTGAWLSALNMGGCTFNALAICQKYGFTKVTRQGGTCGTICGYCGAFTCQAPQGVFAIGAAYTNFDGGGGAVNAMGCTVQWECAP